MLGEFAPLKSKHDGGVANAVKQSLKATQNVIANKVKQSFLHCHCEPKARQSFQLHNNRLPRRYAPRNDDCNVCGRSMIEMLGVLAIIAVLSVAGISGFGKMMKAYHWNTALGQWDVLINAVVKYEEQLHINKNPAGGADLTYISLIPILKAAGDLPDNMQIIGDNDMYLVDALGNKLRVYSHNTGYIGIGYFVEKNDIEACKMILTTGKQNHNLFQYVKFYNLDTNDDKDKKQKNSFFGDYKTQCKDNSCLRDLTVSQINEICKSPTACKDTNSCHYLIYWF